MSPDILGVMIPLAAVILGIGAGIVGITARHREQMQRADLRHRERLAAIEKGMELPPDPPEPFGRQPRYLLKGLLWTFGGVALYFTLGSLAGDEESMLGAIPGAIGLAYLVYYFVQGRHEEKIAQAAAEKAAAAAEARDVMPR